MLPRTVIQNAVGFIILICWIAALLGDLFNQDPTALQYVTPVMLLYGGFLFGDSIFKVRREEPKKHEEVRTDEI
jgi:archaellum biogenesis protein FlaJ (TadC family)